eukprot:1117-Heterococcus_DN1.PRE.2
MAVQNTANADLPICGYTKTRATAIASTHVQCVVVLASMEKVCLVVAECVSYNVLQVNDVVVLLTSKDHASYATRCHSMKFGGMQYCYDANAATVVPPGESY